MTQPCSHRPIMAPGEAQVGRPPRLPHHARAAPAPRHGAAARTGPDRAQPPWQARKPSARGAASVLVAPPATRPPDATTTRRRVRRPGQRSSRREQTIWENGPASVGGCGRAKGRKRGGGGRRRLGFGLRCCPSGGDTGGVLLRCTCTSSWIAYLDE